jgi:hypothetical protein
MRFLRVMQNALRVGFSLYRGPVEEPGGGLFARTFERQKKDIWVPTPSPPPRGGGGRGH